jgi:hypothetical protein
VTGYSQSPRTFHLAYSLDSGETWSDVVPSEVDNAGAAMVPKRVDPHDPSRLFLAAQTPSGGGDQVWLFETATNTSRPLLTLADSEVLSNIAFVDNHVWVAGRRNGGGSLYRADSDALTFTRVVSDAPSLACLETVGSTLLTCANDYSYESAFLVAEVNNEGTVFSPQMRVADLVNLRACDDSCTATQDWLRTTYGSPPPDTTDTGIEGNTTSSETASETDSEAAADTESAPETEPPPPRASKSGGCVAGPFVPQEGGIWSALVTLSAGLVLRRSRRSRTK